MFVAILILKFPKCMAYFNSLVDIVPLAYPQPARRLFVGTQAGFWFGASRSISDHVSNFPMKYQHTLLFTFATQSSNSSHKVCRPLLGREKVLQKLDPDISVNMLESAPVVSLMHPSVW